jgi:hypothetical protein
VCQRVVVETYERIEMGCTSLGAASRARSTRRTRQAAAQTVETAGSTAAVAPAQDLLSGDRDINAPADRCIQCASGWRDSLRRQVAASATHDSHDAEGGRWATGKTPVAACRWGVRWAAAASKPHRAEGARDTLYATPNDQASARCPPMGIANVQVKNLQGSVRPVVACRGIASRTGG